VKRRDFLKLGVGGAAVVAAPSLVNANTALDVDPFIKMLGEGIQEGLDIISSMEYKEPQTVSITGYDANGNKQTEDIALHGTKPATSKHMYTTTMPSGVVVDMQSMKVLKVL
jgi:hypothetical protein